MNILCVYVDGGKGHYIPARAVQEQLMEMGHNAILIDFFEFLNIKFIGKVNKYVWRKLLEHSSIEMKFSKKNDQNTKEIESVARILNVTRKKRFLRMIEKYQPDMIFTTHPYPDYFLSSLAVETGSSVPVTYYATDVFTVPMSAVSNNLKRLYVATQEGYDSALERGQKKETLRLCPFPLQKSCMNSRKLTKKEARSLLGLKEDLFTLQINFGGEGVGATSLLKSLKDIPSRMQVVIIGGIEEKTRRELDKIIESLPSNIEVHIAGYVSNVNDYILASDIIAGRSGINTLVEAFYLRRPFLITELVYTVISSADYVEKYKVGWNADHDIEKQLSIVTQYAKDPSLLDEIDRNFDDIPIKYSARELAQMITDDAVEE